MFKRIVSTIISSVLILILCSGCNLIQGVVADADKTDISAANETIQAADSNKELTRGKWDADVYTNDLIGFKFTLPEGWKASSDEAIAELLGVTVDVLSDEQKWALEVSKMGTIYDMMAKNPVTGSSVAVAFENLLLTAGTTEFTEQEYADVLKTGLEDIGQDYSYDEFYDTTIGEDVYLTIHCKDNNAGCSQYYLIHKLDKYMLSMIVTLSETDETTIDDILAQFAQK